jgi:hypothetical protein
MEGVSFICSLVVPDWVLMRKRWPSLVPTAMSIDEGR